MGSNLRVRNGFVAEVGARLSESIAIIEKALSAIERTQLGVAVTLMSGIDQLWSAHRTLLGGTGGATHQATTGFLRLVAWIDGMLWSGARATTAGSLSRHPKQLDVDETLCPRPSHQSCVFDFPVPQVARRTSLQAVELDLISTDCSLIDRAAVSWFSLADAVDNWTDAIDQALVVLAESNDSDWVVDLGHRLKEIALISRVYARNARLMGERVELMVTLPGTYLPQIAVARKVMSRVSNPETRQNVEDAYLRAFYSCFDSDIALCVPPIRNLLIPAAAQPGTISPSGKDHQSHIGTTSTYGDSTPTSKGNIGKPFTCSDRGLLASHGVEIPQSMGGEYPEGASHLWDARWDARHGVTATTG